MIKSITTLSLLLIGVCSYGQTINNIDAKTKQKIDSTYNSLLEKKKVVGTSIALVKDGEIIYATGYGFQDKANNIKADENTIYRIGSCTKSFTAMSIMQLQAKQKLDINNAIQDYLTALKIDSRFTDDNAIKIKDILTHSSGLPSDILNGFFCDTPPNIDWLIEQLNNCTMSAPAGYQHSYSNAGYALLGRLIEITSNKTYEDYVNQNIFKPIGMNSSFVFNVGDHSTHLSKGYMDGKEYAEPLIRDYSAGLIHSSAVDMAKYLNMYLANGKANGNTILNESSITEMQKDALGNLVLTTSKSWGYGLYANDIKIKSETDTLNARYVGHGGDTWAFHADFQFIPELNIGAVILTNSNTGGRIADAKSLIELYLSSTENKTIEDAKINKANPNYSESTCSKEDIKGFYHFGGMNMNVTNTEKIKIEGPLNVHIKPTEIENVYQGKIKLLGFIPIKIKHQQFKFVNYANETYFKVIYTKSKNEDYVAKKAVKIPISKEWINRLGTYKIVGDFYDCKDCPHFNFTNITINLIEKDGLLIAKIEGTTKDTKREMTLTEVSKNLAVSQGIGRNSGETVRFLENGNLFYSGFELKKQD